MQSKPTGAMLKGEGKSLLDMTGHLQYTLEITKLVKSPCPALSQKKHKIV